MMTTRARGVFGGWFGWCVDGVWMVCGEGVCRVCGWWCEDGLEGVRMCMGGRREVGMACERRSRRRSSRSRRRSRRE